MILAWFLWGSVLLRGELWKYAKKSSFENFERALYSTSVSMPLNGICLTSNWKYFTKSIWLLTFLFLICLIYSDMSPRPVDEQEYEIINSPEPPAEMTNGDMNDNTVSKFHLNNRKELNCTYGYQVRENIFFFFFGLEKKNWWGRGSVLKWHTRIIHKYLGPLKKEGKNWRKFLKRRKKLKKIVVLPSSGIFE